jgi:hypothetical protein
MWWCGGGIIFLGWVELLRRGRKADSSASLRNDNKKGKCKRQMQLQLQKQIRGSFAALRMTVVEDVA